MSRQLLEGPDLSTPGWLGPAWCGATGYVMGTSVLATILEAERFHPNGPLGLLVVGLAPGLLSAAAGWLGSRGSSVGTTIFLTMAGSLVSSLLCAPLTWILLAMTGGHTQIGSMMAGDSALGVLLLVTIIGAFLAVPLGIAFGLVFTFGTTTLRLLGDRPSRAAADHALVALGLGAMAAAAGSVFYLFEVHLTQPWPHTPRATIPWPLVTACATVGVVGAIAAVGGAVRAIRRQLAVARARRGRLPGWAVVDASAIEDAESLPRLFPFDAPRSVLVRREASERGPFRSSETFAAVARV